MEIRSKYLKTLCTESTLDNAKLTREIIGILKNSSYQNLKKVYINLVAYVKEIKIIYIHIINIY